MKKIVLVIIILFAAALRFYKLADVPPALYWDEVSLGYNAYSILKTGKDEHNKPFPLTNFAAYGDYKPPLYVYATVPSVAIFGLNEFSVRFPSAFFGTLTVLLSYFLAKKLTEKENVALITALFLAISPWHLQFSRGAFEANLGLFFSTLGIYLFIKAAKDNPLYLTTSALSFVAAMYTFTGQRLFAPLVVLLLTWHFRKNIFKNPKIVISTVILGLFLFYPLFKFATQTLEGRLRFEEVTIFKDLEPIDTSTRYRQQDNFSLLSSIIHNRRFHYLNEYLIHYFDAFNPSFLFSRGDVNPRLSIQEVGELYYVDLILILFGIYFLIENKQKHRFLILGWLLISPLGPATARETPHALRMIHILPTFQLIAAYGLTSFLEKFKYKKLVALLVAILLVINLVFYLHMYYVHWPRNYSNDWQYGYKQAVEVAKKHYSEVDKIVVSKYLGRPYAYFLFYTPVEPQVFHQDANIARDQFYFIEVNGFDKYVFSGNPQEANVSGKLLLITNPDGLPKDAQKLETITNLSGKPVFDIGIFQK